MSPSDPSFPRGTHSAPEPTCARRCGKTRDLHLYISLDGWPTLGHSFEEEDQEARDREEMIGLLIGFESRYLGGGDRLDYLDDVRALLKRLGRLP